MSRQMSMSAAMAMVLVAGTMAAAQPEFFDLGVNQSIGLQGDAGNAMQTISVLGGYTLGKITFESTLIRDTSATLARDARVRLWDPSGGFRDLQLTTVGAYSDPLNVTYQTSLFAGINPFGDWQIEFYEFVDDVSGADQTWNPFTITFNEIVRPDAVDLGLITTSLSRTAAVASGDVLWYCFDWNENTGDGSLVIDTLGTSLMSQNDTELFLYDNFGNLVASNDDMGGAGSDQFLSRLAFSAGELASGKYFLAATSWDASAGAGFEVQGGTQSGDLQVNFTVVPAPGALAGLGMLALGGVRRRR